MWQGMETGHLPNETPPPRLSSDTYSRPIEVSVFAADLMIARLLSQAPSHPAVRLRKPAYLTAPDIVAVVGIGGRWESVVAAGEWKGMGRRRKRQRETQGEKC